MEIVLGVFGLQNTHHTHCGERESEGERERETAELY
jgi:hypothetical protein